MRGEEACIHKPKEGNLNPLSLKRGGKGFFIKEKIFLISGEKVE